VLEQFGRTCGKNGDVLLYICSRFGHTVGYQKLSTALQSMGSKSRQPEANTYVVLTCTGTDTQKRHHTNAQVTSCSPSSAGRWQQVTSRMMEGMQQITPAKRKRLLKSFGSCPAGYTHDDLERFLDLLYGMFSDVYTTSELRQIVVSDPFDRSEHPRHLKLVELTDWLEALVA